MAGHGVRVGTAVVAGGAPESDQRSAGATSGSTERADDVVTGGGGSVAARSSRLMAGVHEPRGGEMRARVSRVASPQTLHTRTRTHRTPLNRAHTSVLFPDTSIDQSMIDFVLQPKAGIIHVHKIK